MSYLKNIKQLCFVYLIALWCGFIYRSTILSQSATAQDFIFFIATAFSVAIILSMSQKNTTENIFKSIITIVIVVISMESTAPTVYDKFCNSSAHIFSSWSNWMFGGDLSITCADTPMDFLPFIDTSSLYHLLYNVPLVAIYLILLLSVIKGKGVKKKYAIKKW